MAMKCPHCDSQIAGKMLAMQPQLRRYRICPFCEAKFTVDRATKRRQVIAMVLALVSLYATVRLTMNGADWLILSCLSYAVLAVYIYLANSHVVAVPCEE